MLNSSPPGTNMILHSQLLLGEVLPIVVDPKRDLIFYALKATFSTPPLPYQKQSCTVLSFL